MAKPIEKRRCHVCGQHSLRRVRRPFEYQMSHDGRPPVTIRIPDLDVTACVNPDCHPEDPGETIGIDDAAAIRIGEETCRQLGLLTPAEIRAGRERLALTQQELQEILGLGGNSLSRWENGRVYQSRSMDTLLRLVFGDQNGRGILEKLRNREMLAKHGDVPVFGYLAGIDVDQLEIRKERIKDPTTFTFKSAA